MEKAVSAHLEELGNAVQATTASADSKHAAAWILGRLPALYVLLRQTDESRYDDEITRLFQRLISELVKAGPTCPDAQKLAADIPEALRRLHEGLGLPRVTLKAPKPPPPLPRPRKLRKVTKDQ